MQGSTVFVSVKGYYPYIYIEVPEKLKLENEDDFENLRKDLNKKLCEKAKFEDNLIHRVILENKYDLLCFRGYQSKKSRFL